MEEEGRMDKVCVAEGAKRVVNYAGFVLIFAIDNAKGPESTPHVIPNLIGSVA